MRYLDMFEVTVEETGADRTLLVVAADEREARRLAKLRGRVKSIEASPGPFAVRGDSRVIGAVELGMAN